MKTQIQTHMAYVEYDAYLRGYQAQDIAQVNSEERAEDYESQQWAKEMDAMARAEARYYESYQPHIDDMDHEDRMG